MNIKSAFKRYPPSPKDIEAKKKAVNQKDTQDALAGPI